jgi:O-antigen biosynthesis protein
MIRNPYFNTEEQQSTSTVETKMEFKQYPEEGKPVETIKGLTSIIIPAYFMNYPLFHFTGNCIGSVREHTDKEKTPYEIILVINGNTGIGWLDKEKQTWNGLPAKEAHVDKIIANEENLGYAKAVNQGIRCASGEYLVFLNNDVQVFDCWLEDLQDALNCGLDLVEASPLYGMPYARAVEAKRFRDNTNPGIDSHEKYFNGTPDFSCVMTRKELLNKIGLFDEEFFAYAEDLDLIRRIEKEGGKVAATMRVRTHHIIQGTSSYIENTPEIMNKSKEKLLKKWGY